MQVTLALTKTSQQDVQILLFFLRWHVAFSLTLQPAQSPTVPGIYSKNTLPPVLFDVCKNWDDILFPGPVQRKRHAI